MPTARGDSFPLSDCGIIVLCDDHLTATLYFANCFIIIARSRWEDSSSGYSADYKLLRALALSVFWSPKQLQESVFPEPPKAELANTGTSRQAWRQTQTL